LDEVETRERPVAPLTQVLACVRGHERISGIWSLH